MKKIAFVLLFCGSFFVAQSQDSIKYPLADVYQKKAAKAFDESNYDTACLYANLHLDIELALDLPRNESVILSYITKAFCEFREGNYKNAIEVYNLALPWMNNSGSAAFAKSFFEFIDLCYTMMEQGDSVYFQYSDKDYRKNFVFRIDEVLWRKGSKFRVKINAGLNDGLIMGAVAFPISAPTSEGDPERIFQLGKGEIVSIGPWTAEAEIEVYDSNDRYNWVQEGDILESRIFSKFKDETIIYKLLSNDVFFRDNSYEKMVNARYIIHYDSKAFKDLLLLLMADQVFETEEYVREGDRFINPDTVGQNQGYSIHDLFLNPDTSDIEDYLEFVSYFPRKYMGKDYKVNETYATWLLNHSPSTPFVILDSLLNEPDAGRRQKILLFNKTDLYGDFYEKWAEKATEFAAKQDFEKALLINNRMLEAARFFNNPRIKAHAFDNRAKTLGEQNAYAFSIAFYDSAVVAYMKLKDTLGQVRAMYKKGSIYGGWAKYAEAEKEFDKAIALLKKKTGKKGTYEERELMAYILWDKGYHVSQKGDYDGAIKAYTRAGEILDSIGGTTSDRATVMRNLGYVSKKKGLYAQALEQYNKAKQLFLAAGNQEKYATANDDIADTYFKMGQYREAIEYYNKAYEIKLTLDDKSGAGFSKSNIGQAYWNLGEFDTAIIFHSEAVVLRKQANDIVGTAYSFEKIADLWKESGNFDSSLQYYHQAEAYYIANNDTTDKLAYLKESVGGLYYTMKNYEQAAYFYRRAQQIYAGIHNDLGTANNLYNIGLCYYNTKAYAQAKDYLAQARIAYTKMKDKESMMQTGIYLSLIASEGYGDYPLAEKEMADALQLAKESNSLTNKGWVWQQLGFLKYTQGKLDIAKKYYDSSLTAYNESGDYSGAAYTKLRIGYYYIDKGEFQKSRNLYWEVANLGIEKKNYLLTSSAFIDLAHYYNLVGEYDSAKGVANQSLTLNKDVDNEYIEAGAYLILGNTYNYLAEYKTAVQYYRQADSIYKQANDALNRAVAKNNVGTINFYQGNYTDALAQFYEVYNELKKVNYEGDFLVTAYLNIGEVYLEDGVLPEAENYLKLALATAQKQGNRRHVTAANLLLGKQKLKLKKYAEAKSYLLASYKDYNKIGEKDRLIEINTLLGKLYYETNKADSAREFLNAALLAGQQTGSSYYMWEPYSLSAGLYLKHADTAKAFEHLKNSIEVLENIKRNIAGRSGNLISFAKASDKYKIYLKMVELLVAQNDVGQAFYYQEKANIAGLQEQTRGGDNGPTRSNELLEGVAEQNVAKELELKIDGYSAELIKERSKPKDKQSAEKIKTLQGLLSVSEENYNRFVDSAVKTSTKDQASLSNSINPRELDDARYDLSDGDVVIEYLSTETQLVIFVASNNSLDARKVIIAQTDLAEAVNQFYADVSTPASNKEIVLKNSDKLYQIFIAPIADLIEGKQRLAIVPTGIMYSLPLQVLGEMKDGKMEYLIAKYEITYINNLKFVYQAQPNGEITVKGILCFGNADNTLGNAEKEVKKIGSFFSSASVFVGDSATEDKAKTMMNNFTVVHFATHGRLNPAKFEDSYLVLAPNYVAGNDGKLTMTEIREFKTLRGIRLMVLSACDMAVKEKNTEGWINTPANEFILKGVGSVIAPLWKVHDEATSVLMVNFYENLKNGMGISEALRHSQTQLAQSENFSHPYYWSAFENIGKW